MTQHHISWNYVMTNCCSSLEFGSPRVQSKPLCPFLLRVMSDLVYKRNHISVQAAAKGSIMHCIMCTHHIIQHSTVPHQPWNAGHPLYQTSLDVRHSSTVILETDERQDMGLRSSFRMKTYPTCFSRQAQARPASLGYKGLEIERYIVTCTALHESVDQGKACV